MNLASGILLYSCHRVPCVTGKVQRMKQLSMVYVAIPYAITVEAKSVRTVHWKVENSLPLR